MTLAPPLRVSRLVLENVSKSFGSIRALSGVSFDVLTKSRTVLSGMVRRAVTLTTAEYMPGTITSPPASSWIVAMTSLSLAMTHRANPAARQTVC